MRIHVNFIEVIENRFDGSQFYDTTITYLTVNDKKFEISLDMESLGWIRRDLEAAKNYVFDKSSYRKLVCDLNTISGQDLNPVWRDIDVGDKVIFFGKYSYIKNEYSL